jgi:hypothetical protein
MPTLRQLLDGAVEVFDATVADQFKVVEASVGSKVNVVMPKCYRPPRFSPKEIEAAATVQEAIAMQAQIMDGWRFQNEYQRGYKDGFQAASEKQKETKQRQTPPPFIQSNREVDFEE